MKIVGEKRVLIDNHLSEFVSDTLSKVDPEYIVKSFKDCRADSLFFQAKCHWGNAYYDTKVGHKHKFLKFDLIRKIEKYTKKYNMNLSLYYSVRWDEYAFRNNPDWRSVDANGNFQPGPPTRWRWLCFNSPYRDYTFAQIEELVKNYDFSRLFLDILHYYYLCYCNYCKNLWKIKFKEEMPVDMTEETLVKLYEFKIDIVDDYLRNVQNIIKKLGKSVGITHNVGVPNTYDDYVFREADPTSSNLFNPGMWIEYELAIAKNKPLEIAFCWDNPAYGGKTKEQFVYELASSYARSVEGVLVYGNSDIRTGFFEKSDLKKLKEVYRIIDQIIKLRKGIKNYAEIGLLFSNFEVETSLDRLKADPIGENPLNKETCGAYKFLVEEHLPFRLICEDILEKEDLNDIEVLIIANVNKIRKESVKIILEFLENGGKLIITGDSNIIQELEFFKLGRHFIPSKGVMADGYFLKTIWDIEIKELDMSFGHWEIEEVPSGDFESFANLVKPVVQVQGEIWDSHGTRWGEVTNKPGVICKSIGKGKLIYFNHLPFTEYISRCARRFVEIVKLSMFKIGYKPKIIVNAVKTLEVIYNRNKEGFVVFLVNCNVTRPLAGKSSEIPVVDIADIIPLNNVVIETILPVKKVFDINGKRINIESKKGKILIRVPEINQIQSIILKI